MFKCAMSEIGVTLSVWAIYVRVKCPVGQRHHLLVPLTLGHVLCYTRRGRQRASLLMRLVTWMMGRALETLEGSES